MGTSDVNNLMQLDIYIYIFNVVCDCVTISSAQWKLRSGFVHHRRL